MKRRLIGTAVLVILALSCARIEAATEYPDNQTPATEQGSSGSSSTPATRTIKVSADIEDGTAPESRARLDGVRVLWEDGDAIRVMEDRNPSSGTTRAATETKELTVVLNGISQGLGIKVSASGTGYVRYSYVKVIIGGIDRTAEVCTNKGNNYKVGIYCIDETYRFAAPGETIPAEINTSHSIIPLAQSSSSSGLSSSKTAVITYRGLEYSTDGKNWTAITENTTLENGARWKNSVGSYQWETYDPSGEPVDWTLSLSGGAGTTCGEFTGSTSSSAEIGDDQAVVAVFPADAMKDYTNGAVTISLPQTQTWTAGSFGKKADIMAGTVNAAEGTDGASETRLVSKLSNLCGVLQLHIKGDGRGIDRIEVTDRGGAPLCGTASVPVASLGNGISTSMLTANTASTVVLDCKGAFIGPDEATEFDIVLPAGAFSQGFDVRIVCDDGCVKTLGAGGGKNTIARNDIKKMPVITIDAAGMPEPEIDLSNDALKAYMSYGKYNDFGSTSYFGTHSGTLTAALCTDQDRPVGLDIRWAGDDDGTYTVTLSDETKGTDVYTARAVTGNTTSFYNMIPGHRYTYEVKDGARTVRSGSFRTTGQVRMVRIEDSWNWRDLGGWESTLGGTVQYEWLYRGGSLNGTWHGGAQTVNTIAIASNYTFSEAGRQQVSDLGILSELDLRGRTGDGQEWSKEAGMHSRSIEEPHIPIAKADYKQLMTDQGLQQPLSEYSVVQDVAWLIDQVVKKNHPVAFHCKSGADRTGAVGMIVLALLGVDPGDIARDYELTTLSHEKLILNGASAFQTRRADQASYAFFKNGFTTKESFTVTTTYTLTTMQEKAYYYLNQQFASSGVAISSADLDSFIKKMLGGLSGYSHPKWATDHSYSLSEIYNKQ